MKHLFRSVLRDARPRHEAPKTVEEHRAQPSELDDAALERVIGGAAPVVPAPVWNDVNCD